MMVRWRVRLVAGSLAVITLTGLGACAFGQGSGSGTGVFADPPASPTGASATPVTSASTPPPAPGSGAGSVSGAGPTAGGGTGGCRQGANQRDVEAALAKLGGYGTVTVDGVQSDTDCATIKKFQKRFGLSPVDGVAGSQTAWAASRLTSTDVHACGGDGFTICVDLTHQTMYVVQDGKVTLGPTIVRTGMEGFEAPAGTFALTRKATREWSIPYEVWLPYFQHFYDGMGFHETTTYIYDSFGSHGCVNMLPGDVRALYNVTKV